MGLGFINKNGSASETPVAFFLCLEIESVMGELWHMFCYPYPVYSEEQYDP